MGLQWGWLFWEVVSKGVLQGVGGQVLQRPGWEHSRQKGRLGERLQVGRCLHV